MTVIAGSAQTLAAGTAGAWFSVTGSSFVADIDTAGTVYLETRRDGADANPKTVASEKSGADIKPRIVGPCSVIVGCVAGRQYRFVPVAGTPTVAADQ
jgi:hypothetical protein